MKRYIRWFTLVMIISTIILLVGSPTGVLSRVSSSPENTKTFIDEEYGYQFDYPTDLQLKRRWNTGVSHIVKFESNTLTWNLYIIIQNIGSNESSLNAWLTSQLPPLMGKEVSSQTLTLDGVYGIEQIDKAEEGYWLKHHYMYKNKIYSIEIGPFETQKSMREETKFMIESFEWLEGDYTQPVPTLGNSVSEIPETNMSPSGSPSLQFPFCGSWKITNDYAGHQANCGGDATCIRINGYALDWVNNEGNTLGSPVYAAHSGTVANTWNGADAGGNMVKLTYDGDSNYETWYAHLDSFSAVEGQHIEAGVEIGKAGNTGHSTGPHLHFALLDVSGYWTSIKPEPMSGETGFSVGQIHTRYCTDDTPPTIDFTIPTEREWYITDQNLSWTVSDDDSGVDYFKWEWDDDTPDTRVDGTSGSTQLSVPGQGQHTLYVQAWDVAGNDAFASKGWFGYDTADPNAPTINPGCTASDNQWQNTCRDPAFIWYATDPNGSDGSGVDQYAHTWNTSASDDPTNWGNTTTYDPGPIATEDGVAQYYLHAKARDVAGNDSPVNTFGLWYDGSAPTASILINEGASTTNQVSVRIALTADDTGSGVSMMRLSHNGLYWSDWQPVAATSDWALPALDRREIPVYAQVRDGAENLSTMVSDTIMLDLYPVMPHSANYRICNDVIDSGGSIGLSSASYTLISAIGQPLASGGQAGTSATFAQHVGFLADLDGCRPISHTVTDNFDLHRWVIASGGNLRSSSSYRLGDTTGQPAASGANAFRSASYVLSSGFWGDIVPPPPVAPTRLQVSGPSTGQTGTDYTFTANVNLTATTPLTYAWNHTGAVVVHGGRGLSDAFQASWSQTGTHRIVVTATNATGAAQQTHFITLKEPQPTCLTPLTAVSIDAPISGLVGLPYHFTAILTPTDATLPITYTWSPEPESGQGTSQATYRWSNAGEQAVTLVVNQCGGDFNAYHSSIYDSSDYYIYLPLVLKMQ